MDKIFTSQDYAKAAKIASAEIMFKRMAADRGYKIDDTVSGGNPVYAEINAGRWIARCPDCNGAEAVNPQDKHPKFFCFSCGNERISGKYRRVIFPEDWQEIEKEILKRPVKKPPGRDPIAQAFCAIPERLPRAWRPDESLEDIRKQNKEAYNG
jgi:hypothetical protein